MLVISKHIQYFLLLVLALLVLNACDNKSVDKNPKIAVQRSLENLFSHSFDFETQLTNAQNKDEASSNMRLRYDRDLANIVFNKIFIGQTYVNGSYNQEEQKLNAQLLSKVTTNNIDLSIKVPFLVDFKSSEAIFGLYDFNGLILNTQLKTPEDMNKAIRISLNSFAQEKKYSKTYLISQFEGIELNRFSYLVLDETDQQLDGKIKIRLALTQLELYELFNSDNPSSGKLSRTTGDSGVIYFDFTLSNKGELVRFSTTLNAYAIGIINKQLYPFNYFNRNMGEISIDTVINDFGKLKFEFAPQNYDILNLQDDEGVVYGSNAYTIKSQIVNAYQELSSIKNTANTILFQGKMPVATKNEALQNPLFEWIGVETTKNISKLMVKLDSNDISQLDLVATLGGDGNIIIHGTQLVLSNKANNKWECRYYIGTRQVLEKLVPKNCIATKGNYSPSKVSPADSISTVDSNVTTYTNKLQTQKAYAELSRFKTAIQAAIFKGRKPVLTQEEANRDTSKYEWLGWRGNSSLITKLELKEHAQNRWDLIATIGGLANPELHQNKIILSLTEKGVWTCKYYINNQAVQNSFTPTECYLFP